MRDAHVFLKLVTLFTPYLTELLRLMRTIAHFFLKGFLMPLTRPPAPFFKNVIQCVFGVSCISCHSPLKMAIGDNGWMLHREKVAYWERSSSVICDNTFLGPYLFLYFFQCNTFWGGILVQRLFFFFKSMIFGQIDPVKMQKYLVLYSDVTSHWDCPE